MPDLKKVIALTQTVSQAAEKAKARIEKAKAIDAAAAKLLAEVKNLDKTVGE